MPRITKFKKPKLNHSRYSEFQDNTTTEDDQQTIASAAVQIYPKHVDLIVSQVVKKYEWKHKLQYWQEKWESECTSQGISKASVDVAFEILNDIVHQGRGGKPCCGHCAADPQPIPNNNKEDEDDDETFFLSDEEREEEDLKVNTEKKRSYLYDSSDDEDKPKYDDYARFCECPCAQCANRKPNEFKGSHKKKDNLIPLELKERLKSQIAALENVPDEMKDWHPGSNRQVLDLIHPSLYCFVENVSVSDKKMKPLKHSTWGQEHYSNRCQWLPAEFEIDAKKNQVKRIASYINNLDEVTHKDLYQTIQEIFSKFLPMLKAYVTFKDRLQVIVKAANIIVTPDKPYYSGGTFHTEGMDYEHIAATCIYYYHSENVKDSYLEFRKSVSPYYSDDEEFDSKDCYNSYGIHKGDLQFYNMGAIETKEDRCIVFPNSHQHRVRHFFPKDPSLPAIRKILVFFVVDPDHPIISTQNVDIQRMDFLMNKYFVLNKILPFHIVHKIIKFFPFFTKSMALKYREDLMNQRKFYLNEQNEEIEREFSLCEH